MARTHLEIPGVFDLLIVVRAKAGSQNPLRAEAGGHILGNLPEILPVAPGFRSGQALVTSMSKMCQLRSPSTPRTAARHDQLDQSRAALSMPARYADMDSS
jgi:hypothetical protein